MKWKNYLLLFILIILGFVIFIPVLNVQAIDNSIYYTFQNDYLYDGILPEGSSDFNMRNKTAGHYPATYSFENDTIGSVPEGWITTAPNEIFIVSLKDGHSKVIMINTSTTKMIYNEFESVVVGSLEFWMLVDADASGSNYLSLSGTNGIVFRLGLHMNCLNGSGWVEGSSTLLNIWYHLRFDFDCSTDMYDVYLNGILEFDDLLFQNNLNYINRISFYGLVNIDKYVDAIGYSWDSGNYNATYSFDSGVPIDWIDESDSNCLITALNDLDGHSSILNISDNSNGGIANISNIFNIQTYGTIEGWIYVSDVSKIIDIRLLDASTEVLRLYVYDDNFYYTDGTPAIIVGIVDNMWYHVRIDFECTVGSYQGLEQYKWKVYINEIQYGSYSFINAQDSVNELRILTGFTLMGYEVYLDAIGYSWDSNYNIGDNLIFISGYEIGDNRYPIEWITTNEIEVDKFEFVSNSTGDFYGVGTNNIEGWDISETDGFIEIVNDDGIDNFILFDVENKGCYSTMNRSFDVFTSDDYIEFGFKMSVFNWSYSDGANNFYIYLNDTDNNVLFKFRILTGHNFHTVALANDGQFPIYHSYGWSVLSNNYYTYSHVTSMIFNLNIIFYNGTCVFNYSDNIDYSDYPLTAPIEQRSYYNDTSFDIELDVLKSISFINTWSSILNHIYSSNFYLDYVYLYVNGDSISNEFVPDNFYLLSDKSCNLQEYNIIEITFDDVGYDNNVSISLNNQIQLIDYDIFYIDGYFVNLYADIELNGVFLIISNESSFLISNIKLYGVKLHNEFTGEKYPLEFDYANVNINVSYFYVDNDNNLRFNLDITNDDLEYIQATFYVENINTYDTSFIYTYCKTGLGEGYLRLNYIDDTSTIFYLTNYRSSNNVLLPQDKVIDSFIILFSDNDDYNDVYTSGYVDSFVLAYTSDYSLTIITVALIDTIIGLLVIILPSFLFSIKLGKKSIIPFMSIMSVACFIFGLIPMWLFFILILCFGALLMVQYKGDSDVISN